MAPISDALVNVEFENLSGWGEVWGAVHLATFEPQPTVCMNLADERSCGAIGRRKRVHRTVDPGVAGSNPVGLAQYK
jgi:hypothetical protein